MTDDVKLPNNPLAESALNGACLIDPDAVIFAAPIVSPQDFFVPVNRWIAQAIWDCYKNRTAPTVGAVVDRLSSARRWSDRPSSEAVCQVDIQAVLNAVTDSDITHVRANAQVIAENALRRNGYTHTRKSASLFLDQSLDVSDIQASINSSLGKIFDKDGRESDINSVGEGEEQRLEKLKDGQLPGIPCGLAWLDKLTGGFMPAENWVISGAYKFRKTTLALNFALSVAEAGFGISILTNGDSTRDATFRKLLAMLMCREMLGYPDEVFPVSVSSKTLQYRLENQSYESLRQTCAASLRKLPIYLYDGRDGIGNLNQASRKLRRDASVNGIRAFIYDYAQTCQHGHDDYEKTTYYAGWAQAITGELGLSGITLSQRNEESIKGNSSGSYSPGTKGGGALPAMANVLLETKYIEPDMTITLKLSRDSGIASPMKHKLNPASGLILDSHVVIGK